MPSLKDLALRPLFTLLAKPGLGNPHTPHENELMAAGVKPVAIMSREDFDEPLRRRMDAGHVVVIEEHVLEQSGRLYYNPAHENDAALALKILEGSASDVPREDVVRIVKGYFRTNPYTTSVEDIERSRPKGVEFIKSPTYELPASFENAARDNRIASADFSRTRTVIVIAQADKIAEGKELNNIYYKGAKGDARRVGTLLGFTDNDIAWFEGTKYTNPVVHHVMRWTAPLRRHARRETMIGGAKPTL